MAERAVCLMSKVQRISAQVVFLLFVPWGPEDLPVSLLDVLSERLELPGGWQTVFLALWSEQMERVSPSGPLVL